jgi:hypothetical protein
MVVPGFSSRLIGFHVHAVAITAGGAAVGMIEVRELALVYGRL